MIVSLKKGVGKKEIKRVLREIKSYGLRGEVIQGKERSVIAVIGLMDLDKTPLKGRLQALDSVEEVNIISKPYKIASSKGTDRKIVIQRRIEGQRIKATFNSREIIVMAGPCSVESFKQMDQVASFLSQLGVKVLRGGAFKPRTAPRSFEGLGKEGLEILTEMRKKYLMLIVTELLSMQDIELIAEYTDIIQIGARNMQNFPLLKAVGELDMPVLLKRGLSATIDEWLNAAEYILDRQKNHQVILCERGIRTFETATRNTFDLNAIPVIKHYSWLPVVADPSHATGKWEYVPAVACGAIAAGADGLLIEVHPDPQTAKTDGAQSLNLKSFAELYSKLKKLAQVEKKKLY